MIHQFSSEVPKWAYKLRRRERRIFMNWCHVADPVVQRNRIQAIQCFPMLAVLSRESKQNDSFADLGTVIDQGLPLISAIAELAHVKQETVRFMHGKAQMLWEADWPFSLPSLLRCLDSLPLEQRPRLAHEWGIFVTYVVILDKVYNRGRMSPAFVLRLNQLCMYGYAKSLLEIRQQFKGIHALRGLSDFEKAVIRWCGMVAMRLSFYPRPMVERFTPHLAREYLSGFGLFHLLDMSRDWHTHMASASRKMAFPTNLSWPPLLYIPFRCNGFRAVSLVSIEDLLVEGRRIYQCAPNQMQTCLLAVTHMLSIRKDDGESISILRVTLYQNAAGLTKARIVEHISPENRPPSAACKGFIDHLMMYMNSAQNQPVLATAYTQRKDRESELHQQWTNASDQEMAAVQNVLPMPDQISTWLDKKLGEKEVWYRLRESDKADAIRNYGIEDKEAWQAVLNVLPSLTRLR